MKLKLTGRRRTVAALSATAVVVGVGGWTAMNAIGAGQTLTFQPNVTTATIANLNPTAGPTAGATYGLKVGTFSDTDPLDIGVLTGPSGGAVYTDHEAGNATPLTGSTSVPTNVGSQRSVGGATFTSGDTVYLGATVPGTYTLQLFKDHNGDTVYEAATDDTTPTFTLVVQDATHNTASTADDVTTGFTAPSNLDLGQVLTASATFSGLTVEDIRGEDSTNGNAGKLGEAIAANAHVAMTGAVTSSGAMTFDGSHYTYDSSTAVASAGAVTSTLTFGALTPTANTTVNSNGVTSHALDVVAGQTANVLHTAGSGTARIRPGTAHVTYKVTTSDGTNPVAGARIYFTLTPSGTATIGSLTVNGTPLESDGKVTVTADDHGVATLDVGSTATANGDGYTVAARTNNLASTPASIAATYTDAVATTVTEPVGVSALVGSSVTATGKVLDQYGQAFFTSGLQASLAVTRGGGIGSPFSHTVDVASDGTFSYPVPDASGNAITHTDTYRWTVSGVLGSVSSIYWVASTNAGSIGLQSLGSNTTFPAPSTYTPAVSWLSSFSTANLVATIKDTSVTALPFAQFTLTATPGTYFLDSSGVAANTYTGVADVNGKISDGTHAFVTVLFTKSGDARITVNAGSITVDTGTFTVAPQVAGQRYIVSAGDGFGEPGQLIVVSGQVVDGFGNPVPSAPLALSLASGAFGNFVSPPTTTDANGNWAATYVSGPDDRGTASYTVTTTAGTEPNSETSNLSGTGLSVPARQLSDTGSIIVDTPRVSSVAPHFKVGEGLVRIYGLTRPGASVAVWDQPASASSFHQIATVTAMSDGVWTTVVRIDSTTLFKASITNAVSNISRTTVVSTARLGASGSGLPRGQVRLGVAGNPTHAGTAYFVAKIHGHWRVIGHLRTRSNGTATWVWKTKSGKYQVVVQFAADGAALGSSPVGIVTVR